MIHQIYVSTQKSVIPYLSRIFSSVRRTRSGKICMLIYSSWTAVWNKMRGYHKSIWYNNIDLYCIIIAWTVIWNRYGNSTYKISWFVYTMNIGLLEFGGCKEASALCWMGEGYWEYRKWLTIRSETGRNTGRNNLANSCMPPLGRRWPPLPSPASAQPAACCRMLLGDARKALEVKVMVMVHREHISGTA